MGVAPIPVSEANAIERFVIKATVPLLRKEHDGASPYGTGTLFSLNSRYFLITARHIFDGMDAIEMAYPENPIEAQQVFSFGTLNLHLPENPRFDVAIIEILDNKTIDRLRLGWKFLSPDNVAQPSTNGTFFLSGYPVSLTTRGPNWLIGKLLTVYTSRILEIPDEAEQPADKSLDLFFEYDESAHNLHDVALDTPRLQGASGGSIWEYDRDGKRDFWTPENTTKIVGVQSSYIHKRYFRAMSWIVVASCLKTIDPALEFVV